MSSVAAPPSGGLSLSVLAISAVLARYAAAIFVQQMAERHGGGLSDTLRTLANESITLSGVTAVFWAWASYKLLFRHDPDFGVVSMLVAFVASYRTADLCAVQARRNLNNSRLPPILEQQKAIHPAALYLVAANYMLVLFAGYGDLPAAFLVYLGVGAVFYLFAGARIRALLYFATMMPDALEQSERGELIPSEPPSPPDSPVGNPLDLNHVPQKGSGLYADVYPPSMPDTRLFMDLLATESLGRRATPTFCVEVGCGAAPLAAVLARRLGSSAACFAADISESAVRAAAQTSDRNPSLAPLHVVQMDLLSALRPGTVDVLAFHPPYVPTSVAMLDEASASAGQGSAPSIEAAHWTWAGGPGGRAVLDRLLNDLPRLLAPEGVAFVLFFDAHLEGLDALGLTSEVVAKHETPAETFFVHRIARSPDGPIHIVRGLLSPAEIEVIRAVAREVRGTQEPLSYDNTLRPAGEMPFGLPPPHESLFLHEGGFFARRCPELSGKLYDAVRGFRRGAADGRAAARLGVRTCEFHLYRVGGGLLDPDHADLGSTLTMSVLLSDPDAAEGGVFTTFDRKGVRVEHKLGRGDAIVFDSERPHNVSAVRSGVRESLVIEVWQGEDNVRDRHS